MKPILHRVNFYILMLAPLLLAGCGGSGDEYQGFDSSVGISTPNRYLTFFNRQGDLGAGDYILIAATKGMGETGSFSLTMTRTGGTTQLTSGNWISSGGLDADSTCPSGNLCYPFDLQDASGATFVLNTALEGVLYLVDYNDNSPRLVATAISGAMGETVTLKFSPSAIDESDFTSAYYATVDPGNARATAQKFLALHGFGANRELADVHVTFRDSKDLGYGRDMYMVSYDSGAIPGNESCPGQTIAFFVRNFSVKIVDGFAYGPVNLEAAIEEDLVHNFGHNAIEFGRGRVDMGDTCSPEPMAKFYTFRADYSSPGAVHPRRLRIDLDARGAKAMPQPCITCHGGKLRPLDRFGRFVGMHANDARSQFGDTKARMQAFEVDTFEFSDIVGHRRADYEDRLRQLNAAIYCTYPGSQDHAACATHGKGVAARGSESGEWTGDFGREMMLGWYGGALETQGSVFDSSFVPGGWTPTPGGPPVGADALFTKVVGPNCFVCHGKRGTDLPTDADMTVNGKDLDFSTWDKFITHADEIERLVFDEGKMPLGWLNYQNFWGDPEKGDLLASFIAPHVTDSAGFQARRTDSNGNIILPMRVVARAGPDRVTHEDAAITLSAEASLFADGFSWSVTSSPVDSTPAISSPSSKRTDFVADKEGEYTVRLNATASTGGSGSDTVTIVVDAGLPGPSPRDLTFYTDITDRLNDCASDCHRNGGQAGIPVWWVADDEQPAGAGFTGIPADDTERPALGFFEQVMARVNLEYIEDSLILKKPSDNHHFGNLRTGFDTTLGVGLSGREDYDRFVNWIAEGAACGGTAITTPVLCPR